jgi:hypothetical protein
MALLWKTAFFVGDVQREVAYHLNSILTILLTASPRLTVNFMEDYLQVPKLHSVSPQQPYLDISKEAARLIHHFLHTCQQHLR